MKNYFLRREREKPAGYEENYWGTVVDPDGKVRNRLGERDQYLSDLKEELEYINCLPPGRILDVGCGLGFLLSGVRPEWEKHGVEISAFAARSARLWGKIFHGHLKEARYGDEYFDVAILYHVIEHLENPEEVILEIRRILKPKGHLILGTPDFDSPCARLFGPNYRLLHDRTHISLFTQESMRVFLQDYGLRIERVEFPFFKTRHFTEENLLRLFDSTKISPPFYGNLMTFYCRKGKI